MSTLDTQIQAQTSRLNNALLRKHQLQNEIDNAGREITEAQTFLAGIRFAQQNQAPPNSEIEGEVEPA